MGWPVEAYLKDPVQPIEILAKAPLVEGRSAFSEVLCRDYIKAYHLAEAKECDWSNANKKIMPPLTVLKHSSVFVVNGKKRQAYEEELRRDQGLEPDDPVCIPIVLVYLQINRM